MLLTPPKITDEWPDSLKEDELSLEKNPNIVHTHEQKWAKTEAGNQDPKETGVSLW